MLWTQEGFFPQHTTHTSPIPTGSVPWRGRDLKREAPGLWRDWILRTKPDFGTSLSQEPIHLICKVRFGAKTECQGPKIFLQENICQHTCVKRVGLGTHSQRRSNQRRAAPSCCCVTPLGLCEGCCCVTPMAQKQPNADSMG